MFSLEKMQQIANESYVIFGKNGCPFCTASIKLMDELIAQSLIKKYLYYTLDKDFDNNTLGQLALNNNWQPDGGQAYPPKPQIFMKGKYIGGNFEFYKSNWNIGESKPNLKNPMRF